MILKKARVLVWVAVFGLAAALDSGVRAAEVYPGCAEPGPVGKIWYVDSVHGKTPADGGNGSQTAPWNSLSGVVSSTKQPGYPQPMLSTIPYDHYPRKNAEGARIYADGPSADPTRVQPGDEILLMSGQYGDVAIGIYGVQTNNPAFVTIAAAPGETPVLATLRVAAANMWRFQHISVKSIGNNSAIMVTNQGPLTTSDIIFESVAVGSPESVDDWSQADWRAKAHRIGLQEVSGPGGVYTKCISFTGGALYGVGFGVNLFAHNSIFAHNTIDHFGDDGLDYAANNLIIKDNYVHDNQDIGDGNHEDCMQGFIGPLDKTIALKNPKGVAYNAFSNILIESNRCIRQTDPNLKYPTNFQGIDAFDSDWTNIRVVNNVVVTSACWGIAYASVHGGMIINNTVLDDGSNVGNKNAAGQVMCLPWVGVGNATHEGLSSNDVTVRNNIGPAYRMDGVAPSVTMDHNICVAVDGKGQIITSVRGKMKTVVKPGVYGDRNTIDRRDASAMFVDFDPTKYVFDLRLKPGSLAIGTGNPKDAPSVDITGAPRGSKIDIGAYQYAPGK